MKQLKRIWKKGVAFLLAATMSLSMLPVTTFAAKVEGFVTASGFSYDKSTGKVKGSVIITGGTVGASIRVTIISSTKPKTGNPDVNGPAGGSVNGFKPGDASASPSLPCIQFDTTIPTDRTIPVDHFLASFEDMKAKVTGRYADITEFVYSVFAYDGQTNYDDDGPAFKIPLSDAAKLEANPNVIYLTQGEGTSNRQTVNFDLTNTVSGTTANNITFTNSNATFFPNFSYVTPPASIAGGDTSTVSVTVNTQTAGTGTITINYDDNSAGAQDPITVQVIVIGSGYSVLSAADITLTGTGAAGQGKTDVVYTPEGTANANINIAMVKSITVSAGFTLDQSVLDQAGGLTATFPMQTTATDLRNKNKKTTTMTFADYLVVSTNDESLLVPNTIIGYVTIVYYNCNQAGATNMAKTDGNELQYQRILQVPIKYGAASEPDPINIKFDANGKTTTSIPSDYQLTPATSGGSVSVAEPADAAATGWKFKGWATSASGTVITSWPQSVSSDTTYYAQWEQQYKVTYANGGATGGSVPTDSNYYSQNDTVTVLGNTGSLVRTGYKFTGWGYNSNTYTVGDTFSMPASAVTLTAQWEQQYRVSYNYNTSKVGNGTISPTTAPATSSYLDKGSNYTIPTTAAYKPTYTVGADGVAYTFVGWNTNQNATTGLTSITNITADQTLYAIWKKNAQVTFNPNGGNWSGSTANKVVNADGDGAVVAPADPTRTGHKFLGWNSASDGTGTAFNASAAQTDGTVYYAQWEIRQVSNIATSGTLQEGSTISITSITLSDDTTLTKSPDQFTGSDLDVRGWALGGSSTTTPPAAASATGDTFTISGSVDGQTVWVMAKGKGNNIGTDECWVCIGKVGLENFDFAIGIHVSGSTPPNGTTGLSVSPTTATTTPGGNFNVSATSTNVGYKFKEWETGNVGSVSAVNTSGSISQFTATTTVANLAKQSTKNNIYANFVPIPHLTLTDNGGTTGTQAFKGQVGNDGKASALNVTYTFPAGSKFTVTTNPGTTVAVGNGTAGNLIISCTETTAGTYTDTLTITYEDSDGVRYTLTQPVAYTVIEPTQTVHVVISVDGAAAQNSVTGITVTPSSSNKVTLKKNETALLSTSTSDNGYRFTGWGTPSDGTLSANPTVTNTGGTATYNMPATVPASAVTVAANYIKVPYLAFGDKTQGGHKIAASPTVTNATVKVNNTGKAAATVTTVTVGDNRFELASGSLTANGSVAASGNGTISVKPTSAALAGLAAGTYIVPVTVTYKQVSTDTDAITLNTTVTYVVTEDSYTLTVVKPNTGVTKVEYILNGGALTTYTAAITVKNRDTVTLIATMADGYTASWSVTSTCSAPINSTTVLGLGNFTGNTTATLTATGLAKLELVPTSGSAVKGSGTQTAPKVTIKNGTGAGTATITNITFTDVTSSKTFTMSPASSWGTVAGGGSKEITLTPSSGWTWDVGTYTGKFTVTYTDADGVAGKTIVTYPSFNVTAPATFNGVVTVKWNNTDTLPSGATVTVKTGTDSAISPTSTSGNTFTFNGLNSDASYTITVDVDGSATTYSARVSATKLTAGDKTPTLYFSSVTAASESASKGSVKLAGSASKLTDAFEEGAVVAIEATPATNYKFDKWQKGSTDTALGQSANVVAEKTNTSYTAYFTQDFKLKYDGNGTGSSNVPVDMSTYKAGDKATVSKAVPTRPGYKFTGWNTAANGSGTNYAASTDSSAVEVTMNGDVTLYAKWDNADIAAATVADGSTKYGDNFSTNAVASAVRTANSGVPFTYSDVTAAASNLASIGLSIDASGNISGRPFKVGTFTFTIRAAHANNSNAYTDVTYKLVVGKATPVISNVVVSGNLVGTAFSGAKYTYTVTAPKYGASGWENASELMKSTTAVTLPQGAAANAGVLSLASPTTQFTAAAQNVVLNYVPGASTDAKSNAYSAIYENATTTLSVAGNAISEGLRITPATKDFGSVTDSGAAVHQTTYTQPAAQQFTVTNTGNVATTGTLTVTPPEGYTITTALSKTTLAPGESATFSLQPNAQLPVGSYTGGVTVSYTSTQTGTPTISTAANVEFEVEAANAFAGYITVKKQADGDAAPAVGTLPAGYTVKLVPVGGGTDVTLTADANVATNGHYNFTGADKTKTYQIQVTKTGVNAGSWVVPDRLVTYDTRTSQGAIFYELKTQTDGTSGASTTGDGYYLSGVGVAITATASSGNMAFDKWTDSTAATYSNNAASTTYTMPAKPATLTANYKNTDATEFTVTYVDGRPTGVPATVSIWVPSPATVAKDADYTVASGTPTLPGYTFQNWKEGSNTYTAGNKITSVTGDHTLTAQWQRITLTAAATAPDGTYGSGYTGKVSVTAPTSGIVPKYKVTSGALPGGLTLDENTGAITGIPYEICTDKSVTVTVTMDNDSNSTKLTTTVTFDITVEPATPVITGVTATNVVTGQAPSTYNYVVTVAGPKLTSGQATPNDPTDDVWETAVDTLTYTPGTSAGKKGGIGDATFTASGSNVKVDFTPGNTNFDGASQKQDAVWTDATKTVPVTADSNKVTLSVTPTEWNFDSNGNTANGDHVTEGYSLGTDGSGLVKATNTVHNKTFTLTNSGNVASGALTYKFASASADNTAGDYFSFSWGTATAAGLAANGSGTFTVAVKANTLKQGTYTDTLTITGANGGSAAVYRLVFVVDKSATYTATVTVKVKDVGGSLTQGKMPASGFTAITLVPSDSSKTTVTLSDTYWKAANTKYEVATLVTGVTYTVKTGDFVLGAVAVEGDNVDVEIYQVQLDKDPSSLSVTQTGAGYYAKGQGASISTPASVTGGYAFQEWADNATTPNKISTASFSATINDAVKYTATYTAALTLTYDLNGGTAGTKPASMTENHQAKDLVTLADCDATKSGYSFGGWNTKADGSGVTYQSGATFSMPATNTTLYAVWVENDTAVIAPSGSWTVAHRDTLSQTLTAGGGAGGYTYTVTGSGLPGTTNVTVSGGTSLTIATGTGGAKYTKDGTNTGSRTVAVKDKNNAAAATNGTITVTVVRAATEATTGVDPSYKPYVGDDFDFTKLDDPEVIAKKTNGDTNPNVSFDEMPTDPDGTAPDGKWKVVGSTETTKDGDPAIEYVLEFTPDDPGFLPSQTTVTVPTQTRKINTANIGIFFPANAEAPNTTVSGNNGKKIAATTTPTVTTPTDTFTVKEISWAPSTSFDSKNDSTVWVQLVAADNWEFASNFAGTLTDQHTPSQGSKSGADVKVIGNTGNTLTLVCVFKGEDQVVDDIYVETTAELKVDGIDSKLIGKAADALKYTVTSYHWETTTGNTKVDATHPFAASTLYDAVVVVEANEGYKFNTANFGSAKGDDIHDHAFIDNGVPKENPKTNTVEVAMSADGKKITIRFSAFEPVALKVVGIRLTEGELTTTDYYAITGTDKNAAGKDIKTTTDGVYGHSAHSAQYSDAGKASIKYVLVYEDGSESTEIAYTNETLVYGTSASGTLSPMPANGYTFTVENPAVKDDTAEYDGKNVYLSYTVGSTTYYAAKPVGTLTVRHLIADYITPSRVWTTSELTFVKGGTLTLPSTNAPTADVAFNTRDMLIHGESGFTYAQTPANGGNKYFYSTNVTDAATAKANELKAGASVDGLDGKTVYMCYIDINGNLVYAPVGTLKVSGDTGIKVWVSNVSDPTDDDADISGAKPGSTSGGAEEPEYGETIKANVEGDHTGKLTYEWKDDTTGETLQKGPSDTYTLDKDDVGRTITVVVTEEGTSGSSETVNKPVGEPRTLSLNVIPVNKVYDGTATNNYTYKTTSATANDFTLSNVINNDTVYVSAYTGTKPNYAAAAVGSVITWPAITDATKGNYTISMPTNTAGTGVYRLGNQSALTPRGEITAADLIKPIEVTYPTTALRPTKGGTPVNALTNFGVPATEADRYQIDTTATNDFYWEYSTDGTTWTKVDFTTKAGLNADGTFLKETYYQVTVPVVTKNSDLKFAPDAQNAGYMTIGGTRNTGTADVGKDGTATATAQTTARVTYSFDKTAGDDEPANVTYVTAFFQNPPIVDEVIPAHPDWVGREIETVSTDANKDSDPDHFVVRWLESTDKNTWTQVSGLGTAKFQAGKYYKVEVDVQPGTGYSYNRNTSDEIMDTVFAINTSAGTNTADVTSSGSTYTMSYVFDDAVKAIEIAHVNLSVPQPVVEDLPSAHTTVTVNQALGTNSTNYSGELSVTNVTWSTSTAFEADTEYSVEFDVTTGTYDYVNETADKVSFIVGGAGPIVGVGTWPTSGSGTGAIKSVETTTTDADKTYHVKVTYNKLKGGKVALTDVYVNATIPDVTKTLTYDGTGKEPNVDAVKPYKLTATASDSVWQYWNGTAWATIDASNAATALDNGKFRVGRDYQVIAKVEMKTDADSAKYMIDDNKTKFYLAGLECTTTQEDSVVSGQPKYTPLVKNADNTYTLTQQFSIAAPDLIKPIEVTYPTTALRPTKGGTPVNALTNFGVPATEADRYQIDTTATNDFYWEYSTDGTTWMRVDFTAKAGLNADGTFLKETYYQVTVPVVTKNSDLKFAPDAQNAGYMTIGGIRYSGTADVGKDGVTTATAQTTAKVTYAFDKTAGDDEPANVTFVNAYFEHAPVIDAKATDADYVYPKYVGRTVETVGTLANDASDPSAPVNYEAKWYKTTGTFDIDNPGTAMGTSDKFDAGEKYTVVVAVKPGNGYAYNYPTAPEGALPTEFSIGTSEGGNQVADVKKIGDVWYMWYTFDAVKPIEIAHVNLSVPQPVVEDLPSAHTTVTVNQALGTNSTNYSGELSVTNVTWSTSTAFEADTEYSVEFDVTTGTYDYVNETATKVDFIVSGVGPIEGVGSVGSEATPANTVITKVETSTTDADKTYHVKVTFNELKGGKVTLTDVVVDASPATKAGVEKDGPKVDPTKPYALVTKDNGSGTQIIDTDKSKWTYWNTTNSAWEAVSNGIGLTADGKFLAAHDYRVEAVVKLTDTAHYQITDETKFYIAGYECKTTDAVEHHNPGNSEMTLTKNADGTYTLVKTFRIEGELREIAITYPEPKATKKPEPSDTTLWTYQYLSDHVSVDRTDKSGGPKTVGTTWYETKLISDPSTPNDFSTAGLTELLLTGFDYGIYYMVEGVIDTESGYVFDDPVYVTVNGIRVKADGTEVKAKYDDEGNEEIGWAMAVKENGVIKARYIAKTVERETNVIYKVQAAVTAPTVQGDIRKQVTVDYARLTNEADATANVETGEVTWYKASKADGPYSPVPATDNKFDKGWYYKAEFDIWAKDYDKGEDGYAFQNVNPSAPDGNGQMTGDFVAFRVNGVLKDGVWGVNDKLTWDEAESNGIKVKAEQVTNDDDNTKNPNKYHITVTFPLNGEPDSLTVIGKTDTPVAGKTAGATSISVDSGEPYEITAKKWQHYTAAGWVDMADSETFTAGDYYRAVMDVELKAGQENLYKFTDKTPGQVNKIPADKVADLSNDEPIRNNYKTSIVHRTTDGEVKPIVLAQEFYVKRDVVEARLYAREPKAGDWAYKIEEDIVIHASHTNNGYAATRYTLSDDGKTEPAARWYYKDVSGAYVLMDHTLFEKGGTYYLITDAKALEGYCFADSLSSYKWFDNSVASAAAREDAALYIEGPNKENGEVTSSRVAFKLVIPSPDPKVIPGFADQPVRGKPLGDIWTDSNFKPVKSYWTDDKGNTLTGSDIAAALTVYDATIEVVAEDGVTVTSPEEYTFNGKGPGGSFIKHEPIGTDTATGKTIYRLTYRFDITDETPSTGGGGGGVVTEESPIVYYHLKDQGITADPTAEKVRKNSTPKSVPKVTAMTGLVFKGWSEVDPSTLPAGTLPTLVDPTTFKITKDKWFYAVYERGVDHKHYVIGFPNGTFGPDAKITRAEVATIIARSCLEGFVEGANYGNPGNYSDVSHHWAFSAIAFCAREGVFNGYEDGTFRPDRYITRQELATVVARLAGIQTSQGVPFNDKNQIASWAMNGIYTAYANGWIKGYEDGTFQPEREISRAETVKIFNGYLKRGVDVKGLEGLKEYIHSGVASNNREDGHDEYMTWPDVPKTHWAYLEIIEAANDHDYHWQDEEKKTPPEDWDKVYIDEKWRYNDNADDGAEKRDENMNAQKTFTVTYLVSSNGVTYDAITETVDRFASPKPENMPIAVPNEGYRFAGWSATDPSTGEITLVDPTASAVTADKWFYAVFEEDKPHNLPIYTVTYVIGENGSYDGATVESVEMFQAPSVPGLPKPVAKKGYRFAGWSETDPQGGGYTLMDPTANYITGDKTFYAVYEAI